MTRGREAASLPIRLLSTLALLLAVCGADAARAQDFDREVAFLTIPTGARLVGMGRAGTAVAGEFQSVRWNPAVLSTVESLTPLVSLYDGPLEFRVNRFAVAVPAGAVGILSFSAEVQNFGEIAISGPESSDVPLGQVTPGNLILGLGFSHRFFDQLSLGLTAKWVHSELIGNLEGSTRALDLGLLWHPLRSAPLDLGLSALNLGPGLSLVDDPEAEGDPLPARIRLGVSYDVLEHLRGGADLNLRVSADLEHAVRNLETASQYLGAEFGVGGVLFVRGGLIAETLIETSTGTTLGLGLRVGVLAADIAFERGVNQLGDETHISLSAVF